MCSSAPLAIRYRAERPSEAMVVGRQFYDGVQILAMTCCVSMVLVSRKILSKFPHIRNMLYPVVDAKSLPLSPHALGLRCWQLGLATENCTSFGAPLPRRNSSAKRDHYNICNISPSARCGISLLAFRLNGFRKTNAPPPHPPLAAKCKAFRSVDIVDLDSLSQLRSFSNDYKQRTSIRVIT